VIAKVVSVGQDGLYVLRVFVHPFSGHKEGDFDVVFFEDRKDIAGVFVPPG